MTTVKEKLRGKRVFFVAPSRVHGLAECGRVMAVVDLDDLPENLLALSDTACLNIGDAARYDLDRRA